MTEKKKGSGGKSLGAIAKKIKESAAPEHTESIDISEFLGEEPGTTLFEYRRLTVADVYKAQADATRIRAKHSEMTLPLAQTVAFLAFAHISPMPDPGEPPIGELYAQWTQLPALWFTLEGFYQSKFPEIFGAGFVAAEDAAKND
jgi:hypothetical protein